MSYADPLTYYYLKPRKSLCRMCNRWHGDGDEDDNACSVSKDDARRQAQKTQKEA